MGGPTGAKGIAPINRRIGERLRRERESLGLSRAALARKAKTSAAHINQVESARRGTTLSTLDKLSRALRIPLSKLFDEEPPLDPLPNPSKVHQRILKSLQSEDEDTLRAIEQIIEVFRATLKSKLEAALENQAP